MRDATGESRRRRNDASQPYRFGSRSVPRRPSPFNFAELVSPHTHTRKLPLSHPYNESGNRQSDFLYFPRKREKLRDGTVFGSAVGDRPSVAAKRTTMTANICVWSVV